MKKKSGLLGFGLLLLTLAHAAQSPKLVVGVVVDQMRWDYLQRYAAQFGSDGFARLMKKGFVYSNCQIPYIPTYTAPGHASIYTGTVPAMHGIAGNEWIKSKDLKSQYCVEDETVYPIGGTDKAGKMSPKNMLSSSLGDELKLATNFKGKTIGIAIKDRSAILPAGHGADAAYWYDSDSMNWISSSWYMKELPAWVKRFNAQKRNLQLLSNGWEKDAALRMGQSTADESPYEKPFRKENSTSFPHLKNLNDAERAAQIRVSPQGSSFTLEFAREAVIEEKLGTDAYTDLLAISFSSPDYVGHQFGTYAQETEDIYRNLDRDLGAFLKFLDQKVGKDQYLLFLTADHGAAHNAMMLQDSSMAAGLYEDQNLLNAANQILLQAFGDSNWVVKINNQQVYLNPQRLLAQKHTPLEIATILENNLPETFGVMKVVDLQHLRESSLPAPVLETVINGYYPPRAGHLQILFKPGWMSEHYHQGTTHGTHYRYDTHIPLLFFGWGIKAGKSVAPCAMTDIAPTICQKLGIQEPNATIGKALNFKE